MDRQTLHDDIGRACIALCSKKTNKQMSIETEAHLHRINPVLSLCGGGITFLSTAKITYLTVEI